MKISVKLYTFKVLNCLIFNQKSKISASIKSQLEVFNLSFISFELKFLKLKVQRSKHIMGLTKI